MNISESTVSQAISQLSSAEVERVFSSTSLKDGRTSVTKFSIALTAAVLAHVSSPGCQLTIRGTFKGNKGGQSGGSKGGLSELAGFAQAQIAHAGHAFKKEECLLDFVVSGADILDVLMTVESEARPIAKAQDLHDFDKLLLVSSPRRLYIGRVNITKRGKTHKLHAAKTAIDDRLNIARTRHHFIGTETIDVVLLGTSVDSYRVLYIASLQDQALVYREVNLNESARQ